MSKLKVVDHSNSPNIRIDDAIGKLLENVKDQPPDIQVKIINSAINWEKVKHQINDNEEDDNLEDIL